MSRNLMDYTIIPSLASGMLRNFTDYALTFPFNSRHVAELHGLPNDGCQVPQSGQARVASQQTDGPWTKLGKDKTLISFERNTIRPVTLRAIEHDWAWMERRKMTIICLCAPSNTIASGWRKGVPNDHNLSLPTTRLTAPE
ncbi:hypothetical protein GmHk_17G049596 [Glycine max]|nr:hypothetical protein GmHk_17G049596 [Glycine max]